MATRKKRGAKKSSYDKAVAKLSHATGRPSSQIRSIYKGDTKKLIATARLKQPSRSVSRTIYEKEIDSLRHRMRKGRVVSREVAKAFYESRVATRTDRLERVVIDPAKKRYKGFDVSKQGRILKSGPNRGKRRIIFDKVSQTPVSEATAKKIRYETREVRIANNLLGAPLKSLPGFIKNKFTASELARIKARKNKTPTAAEIKKLSARINKSWNRRLFNAWKEIYGNVSL